MINSIGNISSLINEKPSNEKFGEPKVRISVDKEDKETIQVKSTESDSKKASSLAKSVEKSDDSTAKKDLVKFTELGEKLKQIMGENNLSIEFAIDKETKQMVVKFLDAETEEVIQQFPPDVTLKIAKVIEDHFGNGQITNFKA